MCVAAPHGNTTTRVADVTGQVVQAPAAGSRTTGGSTPRGSIGTASGDAGRPWAGQPVRCPEAVQRLPDADAPSGPASRPGPSTEEPVAGGASPATGPAVVVRGLVKRYGDRVVVDGMDLEVRRGECFALLGPNGAGKTTTVEILAGLRRRDAGTVTVLGEDPGVAGRRWRDRVGVVGQSTGAGDALTVAETVAHYAHYHALPRDGTELLEGVGLTGTAHTRVDRLSGGQRRRVEVALGVQGRPELLFLDEPTTGLDPAARRQLWTLVADLRSAGTTVLLTTHYLDEVAHLADRVGVILDGRLIEVAAPGDLGAELRREATVRWTEDGAQREAVTPTPAALLRRLLAVAPQGEEVPDLTVTRPGLEEVYLRLTGAAPPVDPAPARLHRGGSR